MVAVGITEINRVRDFVVLEFEFDAATLQFFMGVEKIFPIGAERRDGAVECPRARSNADPGRTGNNASAVVPLPMKTGTPSHIPSN